MNAETGLPVLTMSALLIATGLFVIFLLYRHLKSLRHDRQRFLTLLSTTPVALLWTNARHEVIGTNAAFKQLSGYEERHLVGQVWFERLLGDDAAVSLRHKMHTHPDEIVAFDTVLIMHDGEGLKCRVHCRMQHGTGVVAVTT